MFSRIISIALLMLTVIVSAQAQDFDDMLTDAKLAIMDGNYESGLNICKELIASENADSLQLAQAYASAGMASEALKNKTEALYYYAKAVEFKVPQLDICDKLISLAKSEKNDSIYEIALMEKSVAFPEYDESITKSLANLYAKTQQYEKLLSCCDKLLEWYPGETTFLFFKAAALQNLKRPDEAKEYYQKVMEIDPDHPGANMSIGLGLYNQGTEIFSARKKDYEAIAKPDRVDYAAYNKGIEEGKKLYREAAPYLIKAYESGSYPSLKRVLFNLYVLLEEKDKAEPYR
jgi:tetratricopeptide (TPR) repeat protein